MRKHNVFPIITFLFFAGFITASGNGQNVPKDDVTTMPDTVEAPLRFVVEGKAFFIDNEHSGSSRVNGYTLPGFYLRPHVAWRFAPRAELEAGVHWLHFWGNHSPHDANEQGLINTDFDSLKPPMVVPWMRLRIAPTPTLTLVLGSLVNNNGHHLPLPLYNPERAFATNPETGLQLLWQTTWMDLDTWVDWQQFSWNESSHREVFIAGLSAEPSVGLGKMRMHLPLHVVVQHLGGENRADTSHIVETHCNAAVGLGTSRQLGEWTLRADCMAMLYSRTGAPEGEALYIPNWEDWWYLTSPRRNFKHGWGLYPRLTAQWRDLHLEASYWTSEKFVPLMGCYHYSNVSVNTSDMTHDRIQVAALRGSWKWDAAPYCSLRLYAAWFHYFPYTADRTGYAKVHGKAANMFSFGMLVAFKPSLPLRF